jgi:hypothetical protein
VTADQDRDATDPAPSPSPVGLSRRAFLGGAAVASAGLAGGLLRADLAAASSPGAAAYGAQVPAAWFDLALDLVRGTPGFSPPVASRAFGYSGVALYEAIAPGTRGRRSLASRLNALTPPPAPAHGIFHWPTVANSALASILRSLFPTAPHAAAEAIAALEERFASSARSTLPARIYLRSVARGRVVSGHVFEWSRADGGHEGFARNFPAYTPPVGPGLWEPTPPGFLSALQPFWGTNRPFAQPLYRSSCSPPPPPAYSEVAGSPFQREASECHSIASDLTPEQEAIARFWSDDPGATATPPGHSLSILTQIVRLLDVELDRAAEAYAKVGIAVADAFIACWRTKYEHHLLRPVTCIRRVIDPGWTPLLVTPPFPEYTSGHSVQSAAAARVLTDLFGDVAFTDRTHEQRGLPARSFRSFMAAADEAAISRLYGGIHFRSAIERGLQQGGCVGRRASAVLARHCEHRELVPSSSNPALVRLSQASRRGQTRGGWPNEVQP